MCLGCAALSRGLHNAGEEVSALTPLWVTWGGPSGFKLCPHVTGSEGVEAGVFCLILPA